MDWYWIALILTVAIIAPFILACFTVFYKIFGRGKEVSLADADLDGTQYMPYKDKICTAIREVEALRFRKVRIERECSLFGYYYDCGGKNTVIMFHGYRATPFNNFAVSCKIFMEKGYNVLMPVQRGHGESGGKFITFGVKERLDCLAWTDFAVKELKPENIVLYGVSMGSFSLMCISDRLSDKNVKALICDCGYLNAYDEIGLEMKRRAGFLYKIMMPFIRLGAIVFGGFDPAKDNACEYLSKASVPVFFIHGDDDRIVPVECAKRAYEACDSRKSIYYVQNCGHAQSFLADEGKLSEKLFDFLNDALK